MLLLFLELWRWLWSYPRTGWNLTITFIIQYFIQVQSKWWNHCFLWMMSSATPSSSYYCFSCIITSTQWNGSFMGWARLFYIRFRFLLRWVLLLFIASTFIFVDKYLLIACAIEQSKIFYTLLYFRLFTSSSNTNLFFRIREWRRATLC